MDYQNIKDRVKDWLKANKNKNIQVVKNGVIVLLIICIYLMLRIENIAICNFVIAIILYWPFAFLVHLIVYKYVKPVCIHYVGKKPKLEYLGLIISPDFFFAKCFKDTIFCKAPKSDYITFSNWANILITSIIVFAILFIPKTFLMQIHWAIVPFILYRLISRVCEITYAFYKDVTKDEQKQSSLTPYQRISLAIHSYFEIILMYSLVYHLVFNINFLESLLFSSMVSTFVFDFKCCDSLEYKYLVMTQVLASLNLIILSIAVYIGMIETKKQEGKTKTEEKK